MNNKSRGGRAWRYGAVLAGVIVLFVVAHRPLFRFVAAVLIVEDSLRPAAAIVVLGGEPPFRELEAARLFAEGWAPKILVIQGAVWEQQQTLSELGLRVPEVWEISRDVLLKRGVPNSAIIVPKGRAEGTLEELTVAFKTLGPGAEPVILVSSKYHTRRVMLTWNYIARGTRRAIIQPARDDPFDPARWWKERRFALNILREYLGILNIYAGFPIAAKQSM